MSNATNFLPQSRAPTAPVEMQSEPISTATVEISVTSHVGYLLLQSNRKVSAAFERAICVALNIKKLPESNRANYCSDHEAYAIWLGPESWLLVCGIEQEQSQFERLTTATAGIGGAITIVSDQFFPFVASGPDVHALLAKGCPIDLSPEVFQTGHVARTLMANCNVVIWRETSDASITIICDVTLSDYLRRWFNLAVKEFSTTGKGADPGCHQLIRTEGEISHA